MFFDKGSAALSKYAEIAAKAWTMLQLTGLNSTHSLLV